MTAWKDARKDCIRCHAPFPEAWPRRDKKFCTNKCRQAAHRDRQFKAAEEARKAPNPKKRRRSTRKK